MRQNKIEKSYKFNNPDSTVTFLRYLGTIHDLKHKQYKILNSIWVWGLSHRATNRILIYNDKNIFIGQYAVTMTYDLPEKIINNRLAFLNAKEKKSDCNANTYIDFGQGPPKEMYVKCKGNSVDIWSFFR